MNWTFWRHCARSGSPQACSPSTAGDGDRRRLTAGLRKTAEVFFAAGAKRVHPFRLGLAGIDRPEDIEAGLPMTLKARDLFLYASHPMGTCRMGGSPDSSVVDPTGRVWGWDNLRVADASIFPTKTQKSIKH